MVVGVVAVSIALGFDFQIDLAAAPSAIITSSASGSSTSRLIKRLSRAPYMGSKPRCASQSTVRARLDSSPCASSRSRKRAAGFQRAAHHRLVSRWKISISSSRFELRRVRTLPSSPRPVPKDRASRRCARPVSEPRFEVSTIRVLRKSTVRPWLSVKRPSSGISAAG